MGGIYLIRDSGGLVRMPETAYESEDLLQRLLADYPDLLAGDQVDSAAPRRWLLVSREVPLASEEGGAGRWSIDHVFLDQDAVPTLVEVKRSTNTQIRREVVGQMLDYAATAVVYWPVEQMQARFEQRCGDRDPDEVLRESLGGDIDPVRFWEQAMNNLQAGKIRMVFVADKIPTELLRIVEFLNEQMRPAQVLALEVRQYFGEDQRVMVPRVLGQTAKADRVKLPPVRQVGRWDEASFLGLLEQKHGPAAPATAKQILNWATERNLPISWGTGAQDGSFLPGVVRSGTTVRPFAVWTYGRVQINFGALQNLPPFGGEDRRRELLDRLNAVPGVALPDDSYSRYPSFPLAALAEPTALRQFLEVIEWVIREIGSS